AEEITEPPDDALIADGFRRLCDSSNPQTRLPHGLASTDGILFGHFQMEPELLIDLGVTAPECSPESSAPLPKSEPHLASPSNIACIIAAVRVNSVRSVWSCRRPAARNAQAAARWRPQARRAVIH